MEFLTEIRGVQDKSELLDVLARRGRELGFEAVGCMLPSMSASTRIDFLERGYPRGWAELYTRKQFYLIDPELGHVARTAQTLQVGRLREIRSMTSEQVEFLEVAEEFGLTDGFLVPAFGRFIQTAWIAFRQVVNSKVISEVNVAYLEAIAQATHLQYDRITIGERTDLPRLAPREVSVLQWMSAGKTNGEIATILDIGGPTVATYVQRLYQKLDVSDRASAVAKGLRFGVIHP